jgi:hypothetical protein
VTHGDEGWYTCVAKNAFGITFASAYLHVVDSKLQYVQVGFLVLRAVVLKSSYHLLGCSTTSSGQEVQAVYSSRMLVTMYQTIQHGILEEIVIMYVISEVRLFALGIPVSYQAYIHTRYELINISEPVIFL